MPRSDASGRPEFASRGFKGIRLKLIIFLAKVCAVIAGVLLTFITVLTCYNLVLRNTGGDSMAGAFEITAMCTGSAIAMFMPLSQIRQGHIIVDFFTAKCPESLNTLLDRLGALVLCGVFCLLAWRTYLGCINVYEAHSETQIMGIPEWYVYASMVPAFVLTACIGLVQTFKGLDALQGEGA
jgi:TRAP-type C4-dicarboxylate transport system permease small subunit